MRLDPWDDAERIARRLALPGARLVVLVGAAGWCEKCRQALPTFDARARLAPPHETYVWMDLEEHAGLLGAWIPETLPIELIYAGGRLTVLRQWNSESGETDAMGATTEAPDLWRILGRCDWAEAPGS